MTKRPARSRRKPPLPNGARALMASRAERKDSADSFPTPPWATRTLMEVVWPRIFGRASGDLKSVWEPACGEGHMSEVLKEYFRKVEAWDIHQYGQRITANFLSPIVSLPDRDWIITNPPFNLALDFTLRALDLSRVGVAMFVRTQWAVEGCERFDKLFAEWPPTLFAPFVERVPLCKGRWDPKGTTATAYCWLVWVHGRQPMPPYWIPPGQRKRLTKPDDIERFAAWSLPQREAAE